MNRTTEPGCVETAISDSCYFSTHTYFDVCPESPDGRRVVYSRFTEGPPGRNAQEARGGVVVVAERDGRGAREIGPFAPQGGHGGAQTLWIDAATVAYQDGPVVCVANVDTGERRRFRGACQMFDSRMGGLFCPEQVYHADDAAFPAGLYRMDMVTGATRRIIGPEDLMAHPFFRTLPALPNRGWCHAKWSPGGRRVAARVDVVRTENQPEKVVGMFSCRSDGTDVIPFRYHLPDGRWHKPMHWSFYDDVSFYGYDVTRPDRPCLRWSLDGTVIETLHEGPGNHACLSEGCDYLVTDSWYGVKPRRVMYYRVQEREPVVLAEMTHLWATDAHPALSRDGRRVYFNRTGAEGQGSQVCAVDFGILLKNGF